MSTSEQTADEMLGSLTGFEEIAIEKVFGKPLSALLNSGTMDGRILIFTEHTRAGMSVKDAKKAAMELRLKDVQDYFADEPDDLDPEEPDTETGKDSTPEE